MRIILPYIFLVFIGCNNTNNKDILGRETPLAANGIIGKWQLEATKISPGGPVLDWTLVSDGSIYTFEGDGTFSFIDANNTDVNRSGTFKVEENELFLNFVRDGQNRDATYYMNFRDGKIILQFIGCIEECSERYRRIN
ncbi:MAG: lipocalin family protein [Saonia sp.]